MKPQVLILAGYGLNSELETKTAFDRAGAETEIVHINDLLAGEKSLDHYQILVFPGGFSFGDDTGSGNAYANRLKNNIGDTILKFMQRDTLVLGICNGFQILVNLGLLPGFQGNYNERKVALMPNSSAHLECRWVNLKGVSRKCIWTKEIKSLHIPIAHGEGRLTTDPETLKQLWANDQVVFQYTDPEGNLARGVYPANPNGAMDDIAGICDESGRVLGMMPHPERCLHFYNEEGWTRTKEEFMRKGTALPQVGVGQKLFENGVRYFT